ncbi:hypothetical protein [Romboutsia weinsteinii]|uniref:hypothetical protein n=1 Tax=Romboutsia weinsteinii TaxID=2020949 RepID=UPI0013149F10|nr:hypothetical protein [Romboutsia weinsteinii]
MKRKIISSLGISVLAFNVLLANPIFANEYETNLEIQLHASLTKLYQFQKVVVTESFQQ